MPGRGGSGGKGGRSSAKLKRSTKSPEEKEARVKTRREKCAAKCVALSPEQKEAQNRTGLEAVREGCTGQENQGEVRWSPVCTSGHSLVDYTPLPAMRGVVGSTEVGD